MSLDEITARPEDSALDAVKFWHRKCRDAEARVRVLKAALRQVRYIVPRGTCSECEGFNAEVEEANNIIDRALAASPEEPCRLSCGHTMETFNAEDGVCVPCEMAAAASPVERGEQS